MIALIMEILLLQAQSTTSQRTEKEQGKKKKTHIKILTPGSARWAAFPHYPGVILLPCSSTEAQRPYWQGQGGGGGGGGSLQQPAQLLVPQGEEMKCPSGLLLPYCYCCPRAVCPPAGPWQCPPCPVPPEVHPRDTAIISQGCQANLL